MSKDKYLLIRLTESDKQLARQTSLNVLGKENISRLFLKMLNNTANNSPILSNEQLVDFRLAVSQLSGIARNLNQITRRINSVDIITQDTLSIKYLESVRNYIDEVNNQIKKIVKDNA